MLAPVYSYHAVIMRVVDGDTVDLEVDLGFHNKTKIRTRVYGVNAPEVSTDAGKVARDRTREYLPIGSPVTVQTYKDPGDKYGRWLAVIYKVGSSDSLGEWLIKEGLAVPYLP